MAGTPVWKMQGALGFEPEPTPADAERGLYNNGGTSGERAGWHLPVHDDAGWAPASDLRMDQAWHGWFRADFELDVAETDDAFYAVQIDSSRFAAKTDRSRVVIYVNGWNIGIYAGNVGPQTQFTIPKGFLNLNGPNTIALSVTAEVDGAGPDAARIVNLGTQTGGLPHVMIEATGYVLPEPSPEPTTPVPTTPVPTTPTTPPSTTAPPTTPPSTTAPPTTAPPITPPSITVPPTTRPPQKKFVRTAPYTLSGVHRGINNRDWNTDCQPYSQTERCRTEIWATIVLIEDGQFVRKTGWAFNNLTYLPYMTEASWRGNPLGDMGATSNGLFTSAGRQWRTECHTPQTGRGVSLWFLSSRGWSPGLVEAAVAEHGVEDIDASSG